MAPFGAAEIPALLRELGEDVVLGSTTVRGLVDQFDQTVAEGEGPAVLIGRHTFVTVESKAWTDSGLGTGSFITVAGESRKVSHAIQLEDGAYTRLLCPELT